MVKTGFEAQGELSHGGLLSTVDFLIMSSISPAFPPTTPLGVFQLHQHCNTALFFFFSPKLIIKKKKKKTVTNTLLFILLCLSYAVFLLHGKFFLPHYVQAIILNATQTSSPLMAFSSNNHHLPTQSSLMYPCNKHLCNMRTHINLLGQAGQLRLEKVNYPPESCKFVVESKFHAYKPKTRTSF